MTDKKKARELTLLNCELDSLDGCIEQWFEILELVVNSKRHTKRFYVELQGYGIDFSEQEKRSLKADQEAIDIVQHVIEGFQDKRDKTIEKLILFEDL